jgi:excinuclease ABC subunit C
MKNASKDENYELAAQFRDKLNAINTVLEKNSVLLKDNASLDVFGIEEDELQAVAHEFFIRFGRVIGEKQILLDKSDNQDIISPLIMQTYFDDTTKNTLIRTTFVNTNEYPKEILVNKMPENTQALEQLLRGLMNHKVRIYTPVRGVKSDLLKNAIVNAKTGLNAYKTKRRNDIVSRTKALNDIKGKLGLNHVPFRMECYDISHISYTNRVASMTVFEDGLPKNSDYRHFIIKNPESFDEIDDTHSMFEVIKRRLTHLISPEKDESFQKVPNLIILDGGKGQLNMALKAFAEVCESTEATKNGVSTENVDVKSVHKKSTVNAENANVKNAREQGTVSVENANDVNAENANLKSTSAKSVCAGSDRIKNIEFCALAKKLEEVFLPDQKDSVLFPRNSDALFMFQNIRDETHRFAIEFHRKRRSKSMLLSKLDNVEGLGKQKARSLIKHFGSPNAIKNATEKELCGVDGIGSALAKRILQALNGG